TRFAAKVFVSFSPGGEGWDREERRGGGDMRACRRKATLGLDCWLNHGGEMLHALEAFVLALAAEIEDEFAHSEATVRSNIRDDLLCGAGEGATFEHSLTLF